MTEWIPVAVQVALGCPVLIVAIGLLHELREARRENRDLTAQLIAWFTNRLELSDPGIVPRHGEDENHDGNTDEIPVPPNARPRKGR